MSAIAFADMLISESRRLERAEMLNCASLRSAQTRSSLAPAGEEFFLLWCQSIDAHADGVELGCGHLIVYVFGEEVYFVLHRGVLVREAVGAEGLDREGEVHDLDRMSITRRQVDDNAAP